MISQTLRLVVGWQTDPATGLNAQLATVPYTDVSPAPAPVTIVNSLDDDWVARGRVPEDKLVEHGPLVTIACALDEKQPLIFPMLPDRQKKTTPEVPVQLSVAIKKSASADQRAWAELALRAALRVIARQFDSAATSFTRDQVVISLGETPTGLFLQFAPQGDDQIVAAITVSFAVLDRWALGIT